MSGIPGGIVPSTAGQTQLVNTILGIARLRESQASGEALRAWRQTEQAKAQADMAKNAELQREKNFEHLTTQYTGSVGTDPEAQQPLFAAKALMQPGARATNILPLSSEVRAAQEPFGQVTKLEAPMPVGERPAQPRDINRAARFGAQDLRQGGLAAFRAQGISPDDPLYQQAQTSQKIVKAGDVPGVLKESQAAKQAEIKTGHEALRYAQDVASNAPELARRRAVSQKEVAEAKIKTAESAYAEINALADSNIKEADAILKRAQVEDIPQNRAKAKADYERTVVETNKTRADMIHNENVRNFSMQLLKETDPDRQTAGLKALATLQGNPGAVLSANAEERRAGLTSTVNASKSKMDAVRLMKTNPDEAQQHMTYSNTEAIAAAKAFKYDMVPINTLTPVATGWTGGTELKIGTISMPVDVAELYVTQKLPLIVSGQIQHPNIDPAQALAYQIMGDRAYYKTDQKALMQALTDYQAPPVVKERAIALLQQISRQPDPGAAPSAPAAPRGLQPYPKGYVPPPERSTFRAPAPTAPVSGAPAARFRPRSGTSEDY